jgi:hypothetical protein
VALALQEAVRHPFPRSRRASLTDSAQIVVKLWLRLRSFRSRLRMAAAIANINNGCWRRAGDLETAAAIANMNNDCRRLARESEAYAAIANMNPAAGTRLTPTRTDLHHSPQHIPHHIQTMSAQQ